MSSQRVGAGAVNVAIDLRIADSPGMEYSGLGRYALEISRGLATVRPDWNLSFFSNRPELLPVSLRAACRTTRLPTESALGRIAWLHVGSRLTRGSPRPDVWFAPTYVLPAWWRGPSVITIQDLVFLLLRDRYRGSLNAQYATWATALSARRASSVICPSTETARAITERLGIPEEKIHVIPNGVSDVFFTHESAITDPRPLIPEPPELLFVGSFEARKGLDTLSSALRAVNAEGERVRLVLAGKPGWGADEEVASLLREPWVRVAANPSDDELLGLYRRSLALVYPSRMEGFGMPVAEAMAAGCVVIASKLECIHEFAGDIPFYVRVGQSDELARCIHEVLRLWEQGQLVERRTSGSAAVAHLRWLHVADAVAEVLEVSGSGAAVTVG